MTPQRILILAVLNLARALVGTREQKVNDGEFVRWFQKITGNEPPAAWCLSFVLRCVYAVTGTFIRVKKTGRCSDFAAWAAAEGLVVNSPQEGDILLVYHAREGRVAHACFVERVNDNGTVNTIGGNESDPALDPQDPKSREGMIVSWRKDAHARHIGPKDVLVRWINAVDFAAISRAQGAAHAA